MVFFLLCSVEETNPSKPRRNCHLVDECIRGGGRTNGAYGLTSGQDLPYENIDKACFLLLCTAKQNEQKNKTDIIYNGRRNKQRCKQVVKKRQWQKMPDGPSSSRCHHGARARVHVCSKWPKRYRHAFWRAVVAWNLQRIELHRRRH